MESIASRRPCYAITAVITLALSLSGCASAPREASALASMPLRLTGDATIAILGDTQLTPLFVRAVMRRESNGRAQQRLFDDLYARIDGLAAFIVVGDLVFTGQSSSDWRHFDALVAPIARQMPVLPALGNHDYHCKLVRNCDHDALPADVSARFPWLAPGRPYSVGFGRAVLVFLDTEISLAEQGRWLRARLPTFERSFEWAIIMMHRPPFTDSLLPGVEPDPALRSEIVAAFADSALVPIFISGHAHGYEHQLVDGRHFIVTAGGGGPRGRLRNARPYDVYAGPDCDTDAKGRLMRPLNYLLVRSRDDVLEVTARGFCKEDPELGVLETFEIPAQPATPGARH